MSTIPEVLSADSPLVLLITPFSLTLQEQGGDNNQFRQINGSENGQIDVLTTQTDQPAGGHS